MERSDDQEQESFETLLVPTGENLCQACQNVFRCAAFPPFLSTNDEHHETPHGCKLAAEEGCFICFTIWNAITKLLEEMDGDEWKWSREDCFTRYGVSNSEVPAPIHVDGVEYYNKERGEMCMWRPGDGLIPHEQPDPPGRWLVTFSFYNFGFANDMDMARMHEDCAVTFALEPIEAVFPEPTTCRTYSPTTDCDETWDLIARWLGDCLGSHSKCNIESGIIPSFHPTRLLDLGAINSSTIWLRETTGSDITGAYIALSHCWGTSQMTILTEHTTSSGDKKIAIPLETFREGIAQERLPRTFQDAIFACRKLDIRYLWIDALCILQDSKEDWQSESARMQHVYSNAFLTLAADGSSDNTGGLFYTRQPTLVSPVVVIPMWEEAASKKYVVIPRKFWRDNVSNSLLNHRAWVLQERILSARVVHFGNTQVLWECRTHDCCETFPDGLPKITEDLHTRFKGMDFQTDGRLLRHANVDDSGERPERSYHSSGSDDSDDSVHDDADFSLREAVESGGNVNECSAGGDERRNQDAISKHSHDLVSTTDELSLGERKSNAYDNRNIDDDLVDDARMPSDSKTPHRHARNIDLNGYYIWSRLLEKYCRSKLTKETDKLVAISGLAQAMQARLNDTYLVGLWESILPSQLLWRSESFTPPTIIDNTADPGNKVEAEENEHGKALRKRQRQADPIGTRPGYRRAPSWSWAATEGPIATSRPSRSGNLISFTPLSIGDGIETIEPAMLVMTGDLHIASLQYHERSHHWMLIINKRGKRVVASQKRSKGATKDPKFFPDKMEEWMPNRWASDQFAPALAYPDTPPPEDGAMVFCMPIMRRYRTKALQSEEGRTDYKRVSGLILLPHPDPGGMRGVYLRMGVFDTLPDQSSADDGRKLDFGEEYCYSEDNKGLFSDGPQGWSEIVLLN